MVMMLAMASGLWLVASGLCVLDVNMKCTNSVSINGCISIIRAHYAGTDSEEGRTEGRTSPTPQPQATSHKSQVTSHKPPPTKETNHNHNHNHVERGEPARGVGVDVDVDVWLSCDDWLLEMYLMCMC